MLSYIAFATLVAAVAGDYFTTQAALKRGAIEGNPLVGDKTPSRKRLILFGVVPLVVIGAAIGYGVVNDIPPRPWEAPFYFALAAFRGFIAYRNTKVTRDK